MNGDQTWSKDPALVELYNRLDVDTAAPAPLEQVAVGITRRRRRRRATTVALSAAGVVAAAAVVIGTGDAGGDDGVVAGPGESTLTVTEADGSTFTFTDFTISCEKDDTGRDVVLVYSGPGEVKGDFLPSPIFSFRMPVEHGDGPPRVYEIPPEPVPAPERELPPDFPSDPGFPPDERPFGLFVAAAGSSDEGNEVSSGEDGAAGTFEVGGAACGEDPSIDFTVDGSLGSEVGQPPIEITGEVHLG